jgi:hypothetical protein
MGRTQGKWPGETVSHYGCGGAAVALVNAAFVGRVQTGPSSSASDAPPGGMPLRTCWVSAYGYQDAIRHGSASPAGVEGSGASVPCDGVGPEPSFHSRTVPSQPHGPG